MVHTSYAQWACLPSTYRKKVNPGSKAALQGMREGDLISNINGRSTRELTNSEAHALLRNSGEQLKLGLNQENIGSPKRRIYKSSLQENTTEIHNKITTRTTTTTSTRTGTEKNSSNDTKADQSYANQNGALKNCPGEQPSDIKKGVWSPGQTPPAKAPSPDRSRQPPKDEAIPPIWAPASAGASPIAERKEFRPVSFESPVLSRKKQPKEEEATPPWQHGEERKESSRGVYESSASRIVSSHSAPAQGLNSLASTPRLPRAQNPTITLLQKAREGQLPRGAAYLEESEFADNRPPSDERPLISPGEILYTVKKEYESEPETDNEPPKKMADLGPRKFVGIGPVTKEGIPLVLRSEVKGSDQAKWYKKMYDSLHRADRNDDYVTIRYKPRRGGRYGYGSSSGYLSEPESRAYSDRSVTLDSRRRLRNKENDFTTAATMPRKSGALKYSSDVYKNQPGRIEDYEPGHSSIAEKEAKEWWDEVMDIFDGPFEQRNARATKPYMTHALKESGYESDSTLVFRRREDISPLSLLQQRLAYKTVQSGGDVPLHGLRKPAPERPKEYSNAPPPPPKSQHCRDDRQEFSYKNSNKAERDLDAC